MFRNNTNINPTLISVLEIYLYCYFFILYVGRFAGFEVIGFHKDVQKLCKFQSKRKTS